MPCLLWWESGAPGAGFQSVPVLPLLVAAAGLYAGHLAWIKPSGSHLMSQVQLEHLETTEAELEGEGTTVWEDYLWWGNGLEVP